MSSYAQDANKGASDFRFQPDRPISEPGEDRLGRTSFARNLAKQLLQYDDPSSLIIAISGPWGSGKSSLMTLLSKEIESSGNAIVVRFNPWNFTEIDQLITMFFRDFGGAIGQSSSGIASNIGDKLKSLGALLSVGKYIPSVGSVFEAGGDIASAVGGALEGGDRTAEEIKGDLDELLDCLNARVFVFIDDLDRLDAQSLRLMFRLIRLNADFKNTTYVLAFDREVITQVLSEQGISGQDYLEKIVQVTFDIPPPSQAKLGELTVKSLEPVVGPIPDDEWDQYRWGDVYLHGLTNLIRTPRDVIRFVNGVKLNFGFVSGEVDPVDFICLEAIRTFEPRLYDFIRDSIDLFVGSQGGTITILQKPEDIRQQLDSALKQSDPRNRESLHEMLQRMFPEAPLGSTYHAMSGYRDEWLRDRRICTTDYFDKFFYLQVPEDEVSLGEYQSLISGLRTREEWAERLRLVIEGRRIKSLLNHFTLRADRIPQGRIETILLAIFDVADDIAFEPTTKVSIDDQRFVAYAAEELLRSLSQPGDRVSAVRRVVDQAQGFSSLIYFLGYVEPRGRQQEVFTVEDFEPVREAILERIRQSAEQGTLTSQAQMAIVLFRWRDWAGIEEPHAFVGQLVQTDEGLLEFLAGMMTQVRSSGRPPLYYIIRGENVREFVEPDSIRLRVQTMRDKEYGSLSDRHRLAVDVFLDARLDFSPVIPQDMPVGIDAQAEADSNDNEWSPMDHPSVVMKTWAGRSEFSYSGSVVDGTVIRYGRNSRTAVSAEDYRRLLSNFGGQTVNIGTSHNPPPVSVGGWLMGAVTKRAIASYVGPILVAEGYAEKAAGPMIRFKG